MPSTPTHGQLAGLREYLAEHYSRSIFETALSSRAVWTFHIHPRRVVHARLAKVDTYEVTLASRAGEVETVEKHNIHLLYPAEHAATVAKLVKPDKAVQALGLQPTIVHWQRQFVKNKSLYPLMQERTVVFVTLRDSSVIRGLITGFSRYEMQISLKVGVTVTLLRHSLHDIRDKDGNCYLRSVQEQRKDWEKSPLFVVGRTAQRRRDPDA